MVLFPGGILTLKIFEARYLDMVSECLRNDSGFGVCLIRKGSEVGQAAISVNVGTYSRITDWQQNPNGLLGIKINGQQRFQLIGSKTQANNLIQGEVVRIDNESTCNVPPEFQGLQELMSQLISQHELPYESGTDKLNDAVWLGHRLAELFPFDLKQKQELLELTDSIERLDRLLEWINETNALDQIH